MTMLALECPVCHRRLEVDAGFAGGVCRCYQCGALMTVPRHKDQHYSCSEQAPDRRSAEPPVAHRPASPLDSLALEFGPPPPPPPPARKAEAQRPDEQATEREVQTDIDAEIDLRHFTRGDSDTDDDHVELIRKPVPPGRLQHYLRALDRHYRGRTPQDLSPQNLLVHAKYLEQRHQRIADRLLCLIQPKGSRRSRAERCAEKTSAWRDYFKSACRNHQAIAAEMNQCAEYWAWVIENRRLPSRLSNRMSRYNKRPVSHPWQTLSTSVLECLGQLDAEISAESLRTRSGEF